MSGRRILITGVAGFVGSHLARALAEGGDAVFGFGLRAALPAAAAWLTEEWILDLRDPEAMTEAVARTNPQAVVHLAGQSSVGRSLEDPIETYAANAAGTWNLLEAVRRSAPRARVLCVGSADIYGPQVEGSRVGEDGPLRPVSPYGLSKVVADEAAAFYARQFGIDIVRTRSFPHIGPGQTDHFFVPAVARQIAAIEAGRSEPVVRVGNLDVTRDLTDVRDVARAYVALLERGRSGAAYNVCSGRASRLTDLAPALCARARVPVRIETDPARVRSADLGYLVGDPSAIGRDAGWRPEIPLERTLDDVLEEWRAGTHEAREGSEPSS